jgi:serine/threonine-protein kinase RsbW
MTRPPEDSVRLVIPSEPKRIAEADEFVETALRDHGVPESLISDLAIATSELINNAIIHGNRKDASKTVTLSLQFTPKDVTIRVQDQGNGFEPEGVPDPLAEENLLKEVGRGIFIVRSLMDDLEFERAPEGGMVVMLRKSLDSP